jgi:uncharacterized protein
MFSMQTGSRPLAIVTGASGGIDANVALICARIGYDLILAADGTLQDAAVLASGLGVDVETLSLDLSDETDLEELYLHVKDLRVDLLMIDARDGLDPAFRYLIFRIGMVMRRAGRGKIVIAGLPGEEAFMSGPGRSERSSSVQAFLDSLRVELQNSGVSFTCLLVGADDAAEGDGDSGRPPSLLH